MKWFKFNEEHKDFIIKNIKNTEKDLLNMFNSKFNTDLSEQQLSNFKSRNKLKSGLVGGQFKKGNVPMNKGKRWDEYMSKQAQENCRKTTFKKGNIPTNHKSVGSERLNKYGYIEIKVAEPNKWKLKHRVIYEKEFGTIPKSHIVTFVDGNSRNFELDNLVLISRSENLVANEYKLHKRDKELTKIGLLIAKVIDKTNKRKRCKNARKEDMRTS